MERGGNTVGLEEGWSFVATGLRKIRRAIDGSGGEGLKSNEEYMQLYTTVYCLCTQASPHNYSEQLYQRYKEDLDDYNKSTVLTSLRELHGDVLLRELVERWRKHNLIVSSEIKVFKYLTRYYISKRPLPSIQQVFNELKGSVTGTVIGMIDDEREHKLIEHDLLKNVLAIYVEIGSGGLGIYQIEFEHRFLESTKNYYSSKFPTWNIEHSDDHDYNLKVAECLQNEKERVENHLHSSTGPKLMEVVKSELTTKHAEPEHKS